MENSLKTRDITLIAIGNSKGVRIPKTLIRKYGFGDSLLLEETERGLLLTSKKEDGKISWEETYKAMAKEQEGWEEFEATLLDGLEHGEFDD